jgi:lipid-binding SYLF domain-containing protein
MPNRIRGFAQLCFAVSLAFAAAAGTSGVARAAASTAADLNNESSRALQKLYRTNPVAASIARQSRAVLVFPNIVKAGLVFGGAYGEGELRIGGRVANYYNSFSASWGFQAGAQAYGYAVFLMNQKAVEYLDRSDGWEIGVGPTVVLVNEGVAKNLSTTTLKDDAYAFIFDQKGLMAGITLEGTKVSRIKR